MSEIKMSDSANLMRLTTNELEVNPDYFQNANERLVLAEVFTSINGSWEPSTIYSVPAWARRKYLKPINDPEYHDSAGGDHHIFVGVFHPDARESHYRDIPVSNMNVMFYYDKTNPIFRQTGRHGWANIPINGNYYPSEGQCGPWTALAVNGSHSVSCIGLPANNHVSTYLVYHLIQEEEVLVPPVVPPVVTPPEPDVSQVVAKIDDALVALISAKKMLQGG